MTRHVPIAAALLAAATAAPATPPPPPPEAIVAELARRVQPAELRAIVDRLVSFGTRHTLSSQTDPGRGIGAALDWTEGQFKSWGLETLRTCDTVTKPPRVPVPTRVCNVVAIQRGTMRPNDVVILTGHIDSRVTDVMNAAADAPGANDDASGTAAVIAAAHALAPQKFPGTIVYAALSGEEQGLLGGRILAAYARAQGWNVIANLNNDIIGNSCGSDGLCDDKTVRVFSEGPRWQGHEALAEDIRRFGGENDSPSRNLSRFLDSLADRLGTDLGLDVMPVWRNDRFGRGGDHTEFLNAGFPAVRLTVAVENYDQQHQDLRTEKGRVYGDTADKMNFDYLWRVTKLNTAAAAWLASAPPPPEPSVDGAVGTDTSVGWKPVPGATGYVVRWRRTDSSQWQEKAAVPVRRQLGSDMFVTLCSPAEGTRCTIVLPRIRVDDWVFGVSSVSAGGYESPVAAAVPGGAFRPYVPKEK